MFSDLVFKFTRLVTYDHCCYCASYLFDSLVQPLHFSLWLRLKNMCIAFQLALLKIQGSSEAKNTSVPAIYAQRLSMGPILVF